MWRRVYQFIKPGMLPFTLAAVIALVVALNSWLDVLPSARVITKTAQAWYSSYGLIVLVLAGLIEGLFLIGLYFPGSLIIAVSVFALPSSLPTYIAIALTATATFTVTAIINYAIGYYGVCKLFRRIGAERQIKRMDRFLMRWGKLILVVTAANPTYLAVAMISYGIARERLRTLLAIVIPATLIWMSLATAIIAMLSTSISLTGSAPWIDWILIGLLIAWGIGLIVRSHLQR